MISDLLPSAGDEKRHTKGDNRIQSFTAKQATLTHTHTLSIPHSPSLPSTLPPLESNRTGCAIVDQVPSFFHENLFDEQRRRRRRPHLRHLTSTPPPTPTLPPPRYQYPRRERPHQQHSAFQSGGSLGEKRSHLLGHWPLEPLQQSAREHKLHTQTAGRPSLPRPAWRMYDSLWACSA